MRTEALRNGLRAFWSGQFLAFLAVGATAAAFNWTTRHFAEPGIGFATAVVLGYGVGVVVAFALNRFLVFPRSTTSINKQVTLFLLANLVSFPIVWGASVALAKVVLPGIGWRYRISDVSHFIALGLPAAISFLIHKFHTFATQSVREDAISGTRGHP